MSHKSATVPPRTESNTSPASSRTTPADASENVSLQPTASAPGTNADKIRARAYFLWEQAGRPEGDGAEYWLRAEQELVAPR